MFHILPITVNLDKVCQLQFMSSSISLSLSLSLSLARSLSILKKNILPFLFFGNNFESVVGRMFANGPEDLGSIPGRVIPKIFKMVFDTSLLNTQQYTVRIKSKVGQSRERSRAIPYTSV